ncbi:IS5 family transposase [Bacteroides zoogleoformans]|nr:IS5 family transposase [Bacteroides zoogleoformans]
MLKRTSKQLSLFSSLEDMFNHQYPLFQLSHKINWQSFDDALSPLYCSTNGSPGSSYSLDVCSFNLKTFAQCV